MWHAIPGVRREGISSRRGVMDLKQKAKEAQDELNMIKATLTKGMLSLDENPLIEVLSESPKCFVINF